MINFKKTNLLKTKAFSTLEILIAVAILALAFVPLYDIIMSSRSDTIRTEAVDVMSKLAAGVIDELSSHEYKEFIEAAGNPTGTLSAKKPIDFDTSFNDWYPISSAQFTEIKDAEKYYDMVLVTEGNLGYDPDGSGTLSKNYVEIKVTITWKEQRGGLKDKKIVVATLKSNPLPFVEF